MNKDLYTPLTRLSNIEKKYNIHSSIWLKNETYNKTSSIKDRYAKFYLEDIKKNKEIEEVVIVGNGHFSKSFIVYLIFNNYKVKVFVGASHSKKMVTLFKHMGASVDIIKSIKSHKELLNFANEYANLQKNRIFIPPMIKDKNNMVGNEIGNEIMYQLNSYVSVFVGCAGSGVSFQGVGGFFKRKSDTTDLFLVEPENCAIYSGRKPGRHSIVGVCPGIKSEIVDLSNVNKVYTVCDENSIFWSKELLRLEGISAGYSTGMVLSAIIEIAKDEKYKYNNIVFICNSRLEDDMDMLNK